MSLFVPRPPTLDGGGEENEKYEGEEEDTDNGFLLWTNHMPRRMRKTSERRKNIRLMRRMMTFGMRQNSRTCR